jgi:hypothetical protein
MHFFHLLFGINNSQSVINCLNISQLIEYQVVKYNKKMQ